MSKAPPIPDFSIHCMRVALLGIEPEIWRAFEISSNSSLAELHEALQVVMGWENSHLHQFVIGNRRFADTRQSRREPLLGRGPKIESERSIRLYDALPRRGAKAMYEYDFGDGWKHELAVEYLSRSTPGASYPRCTGGARACPPEDCGGTWGYDKMIRALADSTDPEHAVTVESMGGFDPERFDSDRFDRILCPLDGTRSRPADRRGLCRPDRGCGKREGE